MKHVLIDASSAILLYKAGLFEDLVTLFRVTMAESVFEEVTVSGYPGADCFVMLREAGKVAVEGIEGIVHANRGMSMDKGENDTILFYGKKRFAFIIIDDGKGSAWCRRQGIPYINALLVPKVLFFSGRLDKETSLDMMAVVETLGWYSDMILHFAKTCTKKDLHYFLSGECDEFMG